MLSLFEIIKQLRVNELNYDLGGNINAEQLEILLTQVKGMPIAAVGNDEKSGLLSAVRTHLSDQALVVPVYNALYVTDRVFDVYVRKSPLDSVLLTRLSAWRGVFACCLVRNHSLDQKHPLCLLLDALTFDQLSWSSENSRLATKLLGWLDGADQVIDNSPVDALLTSLTKLYSAYREYSKKQSNQRSKLIERLLITEQGAAESRRADYLSSKLINDVVSDNYLPELVISFLQNDWLQLSRLIMHGENQHENKELLPLLTKKLVWLYRQADEKPTARMYEYSENIIDDVSALFKENKLSVDENVFLGLQQLLIDEIKGQPGEKVQAPPLCLPTIGKSVAQQTFQSSGVIETKWYRYIDDEGRSNRIQYLCYFSATNELLWVNQAGAKYACMSVDVVIEALTDRRIVSLEQGAGFYKEVENARRGLEKVVSAQVVVRKRAIAKAQQEAEALKRSQEAARLKVAEEAAAREAAARQLRLEEEERQRLERINEIYHALDAMKLGAWVEFDDNGEKKQFKLAVKILASEKFIFVDKLGLKRNELLRPQLMEKMLAGQMRILNEGAEFADTLSRVVGRIRVGK